MHAKIVKDAKQVVIRQGKDNSCLAGKRVFVTGGAGFIGSHLSEELARQSYRVIILDDLATGKLKNIQRLQKKGDVDFVKGSVTNLQLLKDLFRDVTFVFHQAAIPSVPRSVANPLASHEANATGTLNVLLAARDNGVKKVIYASSSSAYGDIPTLPKREDMAPNPQSPYAVAKLTGEYYCQVFQQVYGLSTVCLRYFNVYGPGQDPDSQYAAVIPKLIKRISEGMPPIIFGDGEQTRDFTFIRDVVDANILFAKSNANGVFNIGKGSNISINELVMIVGRLMGKDLEPVHHAPRTGDIRHSLADIAKAKACGYNPKFTIERGLEETLVGFS